MASGATLVHGGIVHGIDLQLFPDVVAGTAAMSAGRWFNAAVYFITATEKLHGELQAQVYTMLAEALNKFNSHLGHVARQQSLETFPTWKAAIDAFNAYANANDLHSGLPFIKLASRFRSGEQALAMLPRVYAALGITPPPRCKRVFWAFGSAPYWPGFDPMYVVARLTPENNGVFYGLEACHSPETADIVAIFQSYPYLPLPDPGKCVFFQLEPPEVDCAPPAIAGAKYNGVFDAVNAPWTLKPMHALLNQTHDASVRPKRLVIIVSHKTWTAAHRARLALAEQVAAALGEAVDVFGVGLDPSRFSGRYMGVAGDHGSRCRYDVLTRYQYVLACENARHENFFTEKVMDVWLAGAVPIYWGSPNLDTLVPAESFGALPERLEDSLSAVLAAVAVPPSQVQMRAVNVAKHALLTRHQMWPVLERVLDMPPHVITNKDGVRKFIDLPEGDPVALCISLTEETARREAVSVQCARLGIKVEFVLVERHADPVRGCLESHVLAVSMAKQRGYPWVLILEDDVVFTTDWLDRQLQLPPHWEMCMLGHNMQSGFMDGPHLIRALGAYCGHAYIMRNTLYDYVLAYAPGPPERWPNSGSRLPGEVSNMDVFYRHSVHSRGRTWAVHPMLATQAPGYSAIERAHTDYTHALNVNADRVAAQTAAEFWAGVKRSLMTVTQVHTFGDSHADRSFRFIPEIARHNIGAKLCYSFGQHGFNVLNLKMFSDVKEGNCVIFVFGEIDCRCHIQKHCSSSRSYQQVIDAIVEKYIKSIEMNVRQYTNVRACVLSVTPTVRKLITKPNSEYPFLGTDDERKAYVAHFNQALGASCLQNNYTFIDVHDAYATVDGFLRTELSDGNVHILNPVHIVAALRRHGIIF